MDVTLIAVVLLALFFDFTNGFHDAANAIATSVSTRALTPGVALLIAAVGNFVGAHFGADAITIMKLKEVIEELEAAADAFEKVAHKVESIAVKES